MLILHHYTPRYIGADLRVACETFAQVFSLQVNAMDSLQQSEQRLCARRIREMVVSRLTNSDNLGAQLASRDLLSYVNATGMVAYTDGKLHRFGFVPDDADIMRLIQWLGATGDAVYSTDRLAEIHPPAAEYKDLVCGLLAIALTRASHDYVLWFRAEYETTVRWAGDPSKPVVSEKHGTRLTPRGSFAEWRQLNRMHSRAWSEVDLEAADALRVVLLESVLKAVEKSLHERYRCKVFRRH
jgi:light-regulated signal transduction histidine kinase (bacteriophytochrome)